MKINRRKTKRKNPVWFGILICAALGIFGLLCMRISYGTRLADAAAGQELGITADDVSVRQQEPMNANIPVQETAPPSADDTEESLAEGYFTRPAEGVLTSGYGARWGRSHTGIDIGADMGADVCAADGGIVAYAAVCGGYGNYIIIDHQNGFQTAYGHLSEILVSDGELVKQGQRIGKVGSTGNSTGPHLHFEVKANDTFQDPLGYVAY